MNVSGRNFLPGYGNPLGSTSTCYSFHEFKTWGKTWCIQSFIQTNKCTSAGAIKLNTNQTKQVFKPHIVFWIVLLIIASSYNWDEYLHTSKSFAFRPGSNGHCFFYNCAFVRKTYTYNVHQTIIKSVLLLSCPTHGQNKIV